jgi:hypothetical protein
MHCLTSLTLPAFDFVLLQHHAAFGLQKVTFMNHFITHQETVSLFTWLDGQINVTSVNFPRLIEHTHALRNTPVTPSHSCFILRTPPPSPHPFISFNQPTLLPSLTHLHATPDLAILLCPTRSVKHVTLNIHSTLYDGLRPSALMSALRGISSLRLRFGETADRRTVEKVLAAAAAELGPLPSDGREPLTFLEIEVPWTGSTTDEVSSKFTRIMRLIVL